MNRLSLDARAAIVTGLIEGNSIRSISRMTGRSQNTIMKLLVELSEACVRHHDAVARNLTTTRVECDEVHSSVGCKARNVPKAKSPESIRDVWTWVGLDSDSKFAVSWLVGDRDFDAAVAFMKDLAGRLASRVQITTDGHKAYLAAVERAFGWGRADFAVLQKIYGRPTTPESQYSPPVCIGTRKEWVMGNPVEELVSTSYVERSNASLRLRCRRFSRLTLAFSRKLQNHATAVSLHYFTSNFCFPHRTLTQRHPMHYPTTPAMALGLAREPWTVKDVVKLLEASELAA
jgi:IS1 family transposase